MTRWWLWKTSIAAPAKGVRASSMPSINCGSRSSAEIISDVRDRVHEAVPLVDIEFVQLLQDMLGDLEGNPEPIQVKIFGSDPVRLAELAEPVEEMLNKVN